MAKSKNLAEEGINGLGRAKVNTRSKDFRQLQEAILEHSGQQSEAQVRANKLLAIRFAMEDYLQSKDGGIVEVGWFLNEFLKQIGIKKMAFAKYIGYQNSNLSALLSGTRKINVDLALKLGKIFNVAPALWLQIQSKNEVKKLEDKELNKYLDFSIDDLLDKKE